MATKACKYCGDTIGVTADTKFDACEGCCNALYKVALALYGRGTEPLSCFDLAEEFMAAWRKRVMSAK